MNGKVEMAEGTMHLVFANGESSRVFVSLHHGKNTKARPADAYVVTGGGLSRSARRAAEVVYNWLQQRGKNPDQFVAGFDVPAADGRVAGESAGLAFALALGARILNYGNLNIVATGEIVEARYPATIGGVEGINEKLRRGEDLLKSGDYLVYPAANDEEIEAGLKNRLSEKGVVLLPVANAAEALDTVLLGGSRGDTAKPLLPATRLRRRLVLALLFVCVLAGIGMAWRLFPFEDGPGPISQEVKTEARVGATDSSAGETGGEDGRLVSQVAREKEEPAEKKTSASGKKKSEGSEDEGIPGTGDHGFD